MKTVKENFKFETMRSEQEFIIYPCLKSDDSLLLQSDKRIIRVSLLNKQGIISKQQQRGAYSQHLCKEFNPSIVNLTEEEVSKIKSMREKMSGNTNSDRTITLVG